MDEEITPWVCSRGLRKEKETGEELELMGQAHIHLSHGSHGVEGVKLEFLPTEPNFFY